MQTSALSVKGCAVIACLLAWIVGSPLLAQQPLVTAAPQAPARTTPNAPTDIAGIPVNYDEARVGSYVLPDPLVLANGQPVSDATTWTTQRRAEILRLFEENQHGKAPGRPAGMVFDIHDTGTPAFDGKAIRKQIRIYFKRDRTGPVLNLLTYTPASAIRPVPLLLNISFVANASVVADPGVAPGLVWNVQQHKRVPASTNGRGFGRIDIEPLLDAGFGFATFYYGDIDPDDFGAMADGVRQLYLKPGQAHRAPDEWGTLGAWAWGISRVVDYLETDKTVDAKRIAITGVSRLGKTVLWAGARDTRIAAVIASVSGEGGAAISRRIYGETIAHYVAPSRYPYQFAANYARYAAEPASAPMDGNLLIALLAPRPLLLQTGSTDNWSDPKGEFLAAVDASRVYTLLGKTGLGTDVWPAPGKQVGGTLRYYMHEGGHGMLPSDWPIFIDFLKANLGSSQ
ncbi:alpha/beta hydrolase family protein [Sphingomonas sp. FW199]|uniref:alpha/beta hydrolase family protein n=1 Tax=Sphingomonas sp. FW199 TaxID=3400217 RepID=UPI003CF23804